MTTHMGQLAGGGLLALALPCVVWFMKPRRRSLFAPTVVIALCGVVWASLGFTKLHLDESYASDYRWSYDQRISYAQISRNKTLCAGVAIGAILAGILFNRDLWRKFPPRSARKSSISAEGDANFTGTLSPILPVARMETAVTFYCEVLGFETVSKSDDYTILCRGQATLHLTKAKPGLLENARGHFSIYLEVKNIEPLWAHVTQFKDRHQIRDLFDRDYGMREFHIIDPDGCLVFVGQLMAK